MKKYLTIALTLIAATMMLNSCFVFRESQPFAEWGFEDTEKPGEIDGSMHAGAPYSYVIEAVHDALEADENWVSTDEYILAGSRFMRRSPASEEVIKAELNMIFNNAIRNAEAAMIEKNMIQQHEVVNVLVKYQFLDDPETTLSFPINVYWYKD